MMDKRTKTGEKSMSDKEIEEGGAGSAGNNYSIGYHLFHGLLPYLLLQPGGDSEDLKKNFFSLLDNQDALPLKHLFLGLCKTAAEVAQGRKYDFASEADNKLLAETPGFLLLYFSLQIYSIIELKDKTRIYLWKTPAPSAVTEPHYIAVAHLSKKREGSDAPVRYITLESSYFGSMLCEWMISPDEGTRHLNYGDCENDKDIFLDRVLDLLNETRDSVESATDCSLLDDRHSNN